MIALLTTKDNIIRITFIFLLLLIWQCIALLRLVPEYILPSPYDVLETLIWGFTDSNYLQSLLVSLKRLFTGFLIALLLGICIGLLISRFRIISATFGDCLTALQSIPSVAWVPLALIWFGISEAAVLFIIALEAFIPVALGIQNAIRDIPPNILRASKSLGASGVDLYLRVIIPYIFPKIISSIKLSWAFAWRALIAGELFVSGLGLGQSLELAKSIADMPQVMSIILIIAVLGYVSDNSIFKYLEERINY